MQVVSFFAGCGGLDLGFEQAGFRVVWANEFNPHCRDTYIRNHPNTEFVLGDVCKIDPKAIPDCARNRYIKSVDPSYNKDEMSYHERMKNSVKFLKMSIIEPNRVSFREALTDFYQGHQPDGNARKPKFNINKKVLENDNFVVFRYTYNKK